MSVKNRKMKKISKREIFKADTPDFNYKAAERAYDLVSKMDPVEAEMFVYCVLSEVLEEDISKNLRTLQRHLDEVIEKRVQRVQKALTLTAISKADEMLPYAEALGELVSKDRYVRTAEGAEWYNTPIGSRIQAGDSGGSPRQGSFRTQIRQPSKKSKPLNDRQEKAMGIPHSRTKKLGSGERAQFQREYMQLAHFLDGVSQSSDSGSTDVVLQVENKRTGQRHDVPTTTDIKQASGSWDPKNERVVGVVARPGVLNAGGAAFSLQGALGGNPNERTTRVTNESVKGFDSFANDWTAPSGNAQSSNQRTYQRIKAGSDLAGKVGAATGSSSLTTAAAFGSVVGSYGPQAEAVFGPPTRKMAYRYRGTEKKPDRQMVAEYMKAVEKEKMATASDPFRGTKEGGRANLKRPRQLSPQQMGEAREMARRRAPSWEERQEGRRKIIEHLRKTAPGMRQGSERLYGLHLDAGNTPPSEGVLLNADGQITAQAVGYGDDHYLPFNLKKMKDMKGGEYIRTRSVGGPTTEDIYTGLMSGARQVTVISRSGEFTVEFEPDFRGARRHNDKAKRMVGRYEKLLDSVQSETVESQIIEPEIKQKIRQKVKEDYPFATASELRGFVREREEEYKRNPDIDDWTQDVIDLMTRDRVDDGMDAQTARREVMAQVNKNKEYTFRLNGRGYEAALMALEEQFPYYLTVKAKPRMDNEEMGGATDKTDRGYVEPGRNRPTEASAGLHGTKGRLGQQGNESGGKFSASRADFQGQQAPGRIQGSAPKPQREGAQLTPEPGKNQEKKAFEQRQQQVKIADAANSLRNQVKRRGAGVLDASPAMKKFADMEDVEFAEHMKDPQNVADFDEAIESFKSNLQDGDFDKFFGTEAKEYKKIAGQTALGAEWAPEKATLPNARFRFTEAEYQPENAELRNKKLMTLGSRTGATVEKPLLDMTEAELDKEIDALRKVVAYDTIPPDRKTAVVAELGMQGATNQIQRVLGGKQSALKELENVHRVRALRDLTNSADEKGLKARIAEAKGGSGDTGSFDQLIADIRNISPEKTATGTSEKQTTPASPQRESKPENATEGDSAKGNQRTMGLLVKEYEAAAEYVEKEIAEDMQYGAGAEQWKEDLANRLRARAHAYKEGARSATGGEATKALFERSTKDAPMMSAIRNARQSGAPVPQVEEEE